MGLLDNLGLSGLGNSLSNFRTNIDDQTGGLLTRLGEPDNQANLIAAASLLSGEGIPASFALRNQVRSNLLANQQLKNQREFIKKQFPNDPLAQAFPQIYTQQFLEKKFSTTTPKTPQVKELNGKLVYTANPPEGFKVGDELPTNVTNTGALTKDELDQAGKLRDDFNKELKDFKDIQRSYTNIQEFFDNPGSVSDQALATAFAKVLDPGSVAREGEVAVIVQSGALSGQLKTALTNAVKGTGKLDPRTRTEIRNLAATIYNTSAKRAIETIDVYTNIARNQSTNPAFLEAVITSNTRPELITEFLELPSPLSSNVNNNQSNDNPVNEIDLKSLTLQEFQELKSKVIANPDSYRGTNIFTRILDENKRRGIK
jgi:hypothetical protein